MSNMADKFAVSSEQKHAALQDRDSIHRFLFNVKPVQGLWLNVNRALADSLAKQPEYPIVIKKLLAELMLVGCIFRHYMKMDGELSLSIESRGYPVNVLLVNIDRDSVRAVARLDDTKLIADDAQLKDLVDVNANLILSVLNPNAQPYQSIIRVNLESITQSVLDFYKQSVQIPAFLKISTQEDSSGMVNATALFMVYIPDDSGTLEDFQDIATLAETTQDDEMLNLIAFDLLYRLFNQEDVTTDFVQKLQFACSCSKEKMLNSLSSLGLQEIEEALNELQQDYLEVACNCCGDKYAFTYEDVKANIEDNPEVNGVFVNQEDK